MVPTAETDGMTKYQFQIDDDKWADWKDTVPRSKSLEDRIIELIEADTEGRVLSPEEYEKFQQWREDNDE